MPPAHASGSGSGTDMGSDRVEPEPSGESAWASARDLRRAEMARHLAQEQADSADGDSTRSVESSAAAHPDQVLQDVL